MLKKLRIGFAAVIALVALTATIASHAGAFSAKIAKVAVDPGCYVSFSTGAPAAPARSGVEEFSEYSTPIDLSQTATGITLRPDPEANCDESEPVCCYLVNESNQVIGVYWGVFEL